MLNKLFKENPNRSILKKPPKVYTSDNFDVEIVDF